MALVVILWVIGVGTHTTYHIHPKFINSYVPVLKAVNLFYGYDYKPGA